MSELINELISVVVVFKKNQRASAPLLFKWQGRVHKVAKVGLHYPQRTGRKLNHIFTVLNENNTAFRLKMDTETLLWTLEEIVTD